MDNDQLDQFRQLLLKQKLEVFNLKDESLVIEKMADPHDAAIADLEKTLNTKFISRKKTYLAKIENALMKIDDKTYGECESCGDMINLKRLQARPTASLCLECKEEQENLERREKELSKSGGFEQWD